MKKMDPNLSPKSILPATDQSVACHDGDDSDKNNNDALAQQFYDDISVIRRNQEDAAEGIIDANTSARFLHEDMNNLTANLDAKFDTMATVFDTTCHTMGGLEGNIETVIGKVRAISNTMGTLEAVMHQTKAAIQTCNIRERQRDVLILRTLKAVQAQRDESTTFIQAHLRA